MSDCDVLRRIAEIGISMAYERDSAFVDLFQHLLDEIPRVQKQMAETQAYSEQLREDIEDISDAFNNKFVYKNAHFECVQHVRKELAEFWEDALSLKRDTSVLESFVEKAGEKMREVCVDKAFLNGIDIAEVAQSIPKITLEDLK